VRQHERRGVALVLVLWLVVVLGVIGASVAQGTRTSSSIASNVRARVVARAASESGIEALVAAIEDTLAAMPESGARRDWLNALEAAVGASAPVALGDGRFALAVADVSARLDVNAATEASLRAFFSRFTDLAAAADIGRAIRAWIERTDPALRTGDDRLQPDESGALRAVRPIRSLEELRANRLVPDRVLERAAPYLTVDGDGTINRRTASDTVLAAAAGELRDEPSRLLLISRGWLDGHPLTHEIQAVYAVSGTRLVFSHWRERDR
jgi:general secretion pathway protein K